MRKILVDRIVFVPLSEINVENVDSYNKIVSDLKKVDMRNEIFYKDLQKIFNTKIEKNGTIGIYIEKTEILVARMEVGWIPETSCILF